MKIVIAPDSFKESLSAADVAREIGAGFAEIFPDADYRLLPVADGGEGTVEALVAATGGECVALSVTGPLGAPVEAFYGVTGDGRTAVIEMAAAAGLALVPPERRDPLVTTTAGVGELIRAAFDRGARHLVVGLGGSATNDGGAGMAAALGARLLDGEGRPIGPGGGALAALARIDLSSLDPRLAECSIEAACDVDNPLVGPDGASAVFGPQKGATPAMVAALDRGLARFAGAIEAATGRSVADLPGGGAAGGLGAGLHALLGARLRPGAAIVMEAVGLDAAVADADLVITGEGRIDGQTIHGKTPVGVAAVAKRHGKPVIAIAGSLGPGVAAVYAHGIDAVFSVLGRPCTLAEALAEAGPNLRATARDVAAVWRLGALSRQG
ncbi:glycerate kinase [Segnochrobactrum spirostomi]|uniref:Glycerate kinase n=1 Tax=Segnochrobactrum spirostomi TaxID=2608987 RepID=A0A6A7Y2N1_9HYPH|nr:glycerate kinase [Segnochrobactrum spirostomi]MQT12548.1 glycerate kinase [Segnochrobactrum spirostomi]